MLASSAWTDGGAAAQQYGEDDAAWFRDPVTPGQAGSSVIEGHIDTYQGPSVLYRLGALQPGEKIDGLSPTG